MTALENYRVVSQSQADLEADLQRIDETLKDATDAVVRREYEESRQALHDRLVKLKQASTQLERVEAQLLSLANELDSVIAEVIRLQAMDPEDASQRVPDVVRRIRKQSKELEDFRRERMHIPVDR